MNYSTLSSLGSLTLNSQLVTSVDFDSIVNDSVLSNYFDKRVSNVISHDIIVEAPLVVKSFGWVYDEDKHELLQDILDRKQDAILIGPSSQPIAATQASYDGFDLSVKSEYEQTSAKLKFPLIYSDQTILTRESLSDSINEQFFNKSADNDVSGRTSFFNEVEIIDSNFVQTSEQSGVACYSGKNGFIQAEEQNPYGKSSVGSLGYCILSVVTIQNGETGVTDGFKLSGDMSKLVAVLDNNPAGAGIDYDFTKSIVLYNNVLGQTSDISNVHFSFALFSYSASMKYTLKSIDTEHNIVFFNENLPDDIRLAGMMGEDTLLSLWLNDDNAFYAAGLPEIGNQPVPNFYGQHAEGGAVRAIGKYTHVEGRDNIADVRYAHVEGSHNAAGEMASHAEGFRTVAAGRYSHAEGSDTVAAGMRSHAEGNAACANGENSHAQGLQTYAEGSDAFAGGTRSKAYGPHSIAFGNNAYTGMSSYSGIALGGEVSAVETNTFACGRYACAEDKRAFVWNSKNGSVQNAYKSNGEGTFNVNPDAGVSGFYIGVSSLNDYFQYQSSQTSSASQIELALSSKVSLLRSDNGYDSAAIGSRSTGIDIGSQSFTVGNSNAAEMPQSFAQGNQTSALGTGSFTQGNKTVANGSYSFAGGTASKSYGDWSFSFGNTSMASSYSAIALGGQVSAVESNTFAAGAYSRAKDRRSFVWNANSSSVDDAYESHGTGSFNISPSCGVSGFYIGVSSLADYLREAAAPSSNVTRSGEDGQLSAVAMFSGSNTVANGAVADGSTDKYLRADGSFEQIPVADDISSGLMASSTSKYVNSLQMNIVQPFEECTGWINNSKLWKYTDKNSLPKDTFKFIVLPISAGQSVSIKASSVNPAFITLLSGDRCISPVLDQPVGIVDGWNPPHNEYKGFALAGQTSSFTVPDKAALLWCCTKFYGVDSIPASISIDSIEVIHTYAQHSMKIDSALCADQSSSKCIKKSKTANQFNKDDPDNVDRQFLSSNAYAYFYAMAGTAASQYFGTTHFIPCCKGNVLVCAAKSMSSIGGRSVIRAVQYFDADFNLLACASGQTKDDVGFTSISRSSFIEHAVWWKKVEVDGCRYVKLSYDWENKDKFVVQVEDSNYTPSELIEYIPFVSNTSDTNPSSWSNKKILFYGDSITQPLINYMSSDLSIETGKGLKTKGYVQFTCDKLNSSFINHGVGAATFALSSAGHTSDRTRENLVTWLSNESTYDVDAVVVALGTNDWMYSWSEFGHFGDTSLSTFYGALDYSCKQLIDKYCGKPVVFATPIKRWQNYAVSTLPDIAPSRGWITQSGIWNIGGSETAFQYKIVPVPFPNSVIEICASTNLSCDTWYTFLSSEVHTTGYSGMYAPTEPVSAWSPGGNVIRRSTSKTFTSPSIPAYLWITYGRHDATYGFDEGNAWPDCIKINGVEVTSIPCGRRYDLPNLRGKTLADYSDAIKQVCGYYGIKVVDTFSDCPINPIIQSSRDRLVPDGTHPSPLGHMLLAKYIAGALNAVVD